MKGTASQLNRLVGKNYTHQVHFIPASDISRAALKIRMMFSFGVSTLMEILQPILKAGLGMAQCSHFSFLAYWI